METKTQQPVGPEVTELILANVADGVFTVDPQFRITFFNRAAEQITGFSSEEAVGRGCFEIFRTPMCSQDCPLRQSVRTRRTVKDFEIDITTRKGTVQTVSVSTAPLLHPDGRFLGGVETFRDLAPLKRLRREVSGKYMFADIVSKHPKMREIIETLPNVARSDATVLIHGGSGVGKTILATAIHNNSPRAKGPFVKVSCGALPENLLDLELFGASNGGDEDYAGSFHSARGGTLFLNEVGKIPLPLQEKLLRALEYQHVTDSASGPSTQPNLRLVASTKHNLERLVAEGKYREDLYRCLNSIAVHIPELCNRREDVPLLVDHLLERLNYRLGRHIRRVTNDAMALLMRYPFPDNLRELENALEHAFVVAKGQRISARDLPPKIQEFADDETYPPKRNPSRKSKPSSKKKHDAENQRMIACLQRNYWNIPRAAKELGVHRTTLWRKVRQLGVIKPG